MKKIFLALLFFVIGLVLFMPKINLYYTMNDYLKKELITIKQKSIQDRWYKLELKDATAYYDGIKSLLAKEVDIKPWIIYNKIELKEIKPADSLKRFFNFKANKAVITHSLLSYKKAYIEAEGDFGALDGEIDLIGRKIHIHLSPTKRFEKEQVVREYFKKSKEGYIYESKF
jgi:hypothetical protein